MDKKCQIWREMPKFDNELFLQYIRLRNYKYMWNIVKIESISTNFIKTIALNNNFFSLV